MGVTVGIHGEPGQMVLGQFTRNVASTLYLLATTQSHRVPAMPGTAVVITAIGGGGAGGRPYRTGANVWGAGGGGGGWVRAELTLPANMESITATVGRGGTNDGGSCGTGAADLKGEAGGVTNVTIGALVLTARGGEGGGPSHVGGATTQMGQGGQGEVNAPSPFDAGLQYLTLTGGSGSTASGSAGENGAPGGGGTTGTLNGVSGYQAPGGGGTGLGNGGSPSDNRGGPAGTSPASFSGGGGGGGSDDRAGGHGGGGFGTGGTGEGNGGVHAQCLTLDGVQVCGGRGGTSGSGRRLPGDVEIGRRNAGGGAACSVAAAVVLVTHAVQVREQVARVVS